MAPSTSYSTTGTICKSSTLRVNNKNIVKHLKELGIKENKIHVGGKPVNIPDELVNSVILGFLDSDCWVSLSKHGRYCIGWCGHFDSVEWISDNIKKFLNIQLKICKKNNIFSIQTSDKKKMHAIANWLLLNNKYSLYRKRRKLKEIIMRDLKRSETRDARKQ